MNIREEEMAKVAGGQNEQGMPCPECGGLIPIDIQMILHNDSVTCPSCKLVIPIDRIRSHSAIDALRKVKKAQEALANKQQ